MRDNTAPPPFYRMNIITSYLKIKFLHEKTPTKCKNRKKFNVLNDENLFD